ncbi:citrate:proton symporter [Domibacillus sp. DTU_2020_1001157_1_SI_ALB_TIR_016]|uniref:CitMHS family transporter n=1 Tax=Domibacillus sp. DTU_2020_1001157_1_SI_ALB_TIR_016 TaxID=3077789 RepID=UPI0028EB0D8C|nr:citrate:proton symporter [Domibacillus sp. DTU_2020_1001157_1_SI_ALB_TIR_016]WNS78885.1 citrate:proton symporter [Domibacillus sp. DTU_2020_1001157_1_SI_ALB_TIR_016]
MLAALGFSMVAVFMYLIMSKKLSALVAIMLVPIVFGILGGFLTELGPMMQEGVESIASTAIMILFAILYFGIMIDSGLFDPLIAKILKIVKGDPLKIVLGTAVLSMTVALDGDGTTTYIITVSALLPLYKRLGMNRLILATVAMLSMGVMNMTPWGGASAMAMASLGLDASELFIPMIPVMGIGLVWVLTVAFLLGRKERKRLGVIELDSAHQSAENTGLAATTLNADYKRPKLVWFNLLLTIVLMASLIIDFMSLTILFMIAFGIALLVNYPDLKDQQERLAAHSKNALAVVSIVIAAGIFTGIMSGTKMIDAMAVTLVSIIPDSFGPFLPVIVAFLSAPFTFFMSNNAFYFGVLPIIAQAAEAYGISAVEIGRASLLGQPVHVLSPLVAAAHLLIGLVGTEFGDLQRFAVKWALGTTTVMTVAAVLFGIISI